VTLSYWFTLIFKIRIGDFMRAKNTIITAIIMGLLICPVLAFAQQVPPAQKASGQEALRQIQDKEFRLRKMIRQEEPEIDEPEIAAPNLEDLPETEAVLIETINVEGADLLSQSEIDKIINPYLGKNLSLRDMQEVANKITDAYRNKGYITSRAILPPQTIQNNTVTIEIIEGTTGDVDVRGNRHFRTSLIRKRIMLKKGTPFDYDKMQRNLSQLNEHPDRTVNAVLAPGADRGTTDVILEVDDQLPIHIGFTVDNFASRFVDKYRYQGTLKHNNLLGFDDILTLQFQTSNSQMSELTSLRYLFPITNKTQISFYGARGDTELGDSLSALEARGKSRIYNVLLTHNLIETDRVTFGLTGGFEYKDIFNFTLNVEDSRDRTRIARTGFNLDILDNHGRWIVQNTIDWGIPNIMGGLKGVDGASSRTGAGGDFVKNVLDVVRLNQFVMDSTLLLKTQFQFSDANLPASEQFQIGGIANVRGYPPGEAIGDYGQTATAEITFPVPAFPKDAKIPFTQNAYWDDALRLATFYDWGRVKYKSVLSGESETENLSSAGVGLRVSLPEDFYIRVDVAWPLSSKNASDTDHAHTWFQVSKEF
jgi:hemolysin activation/secretion protein